MLQLKVHLSTLFTTVQYAIIVTTDGDYSFECNVVCANMPNMPTGI